MRGGLDSIGILLTRLLQFCAMTVPNTSGGFDSLANRMTRQCKYETQRRLIHFGSETQFAT